MPAIRGEYMQTKKDIILLNFVNIDLINFCKENKIDCSDIYVFKHPRKQVYTLVRYGDHKSLAVVEFTKNSVPVHTIYN